MKLRILSGPSFGRSTLSLRLTSKSVVALFWLVFGLADSADAIDPNESAADRPPEWASPMPETNGLPNFFKVSDVLYRGAQPEEEGFPELNKLGIKTVVNLRTMHSDRKDTARAGLKYV